MFESLLNNSEAGLLFLRFVIGFIFVYHGVMKWKMPSTSEGIGTIIRVLKYVEPVAGAMLILGMYSQMMALLFCVLMIGAIVMKITVWKQAFSSMKSTGWEFDLVLLAGSLVLLTNTMG